MLYIKQKIGYNRYIVADTDDNSEELCTYEKLKYCVLDVGLKIEGVTVDSENCITIHCYNNLTDIKALKFRVLYGISLLVNSNGTLCNMDVDNKEINYILNLEDWCTSLADFCFENIHITNPAMKVTVILSDKIKFNCRAFEFCSDSNLSFDFSRLSDETAKIAYNSFLISNDSCLLMRVAHKISAVKIIDNQERYAYYVILKALFCRDALNMYTVHELTPKKLYESTIEEIIKIYRPKWFEICNSNIKLSLQGKTPILQVDIPSIENMTLILTTVIRYGIGVDNFSLSVLIGYLTWVCTHDFDLIKAVMDLGRRLKSEYYL